MTTIGPTAFAVVVDRLHVGCEVVCLKCAQRFQLDAAALTMTVGREVIGYCGPCCLTASMRARLAKADRGKVAQ